MTFAINQIKIIGMGMSKKNLPSTYLWMITSADILVGGRRHLDLFDTYHCEKKVIDKDLSKLVSYLKDHSKTRKIVVLASGDPLFFGIGGYLINALGPKHIEIFPNVTTVSAAFAKIKEPWQEAKVVSLHGRKAEADLIRVLSGDDVVAVYTDREKTPTWLARFLMSNNLTDFNLCILECLGSVNERVEWYSLTQAAEKSFRSPNLVILKRNRLNSDIKKVTHFGMPEEWYDHQKGLITKAEVRAVTLSKLCLKSDNILWDIGAGSGSVGIEASLFIQRGRIFAVEKDPDRVRHIKANKQRFGVCNLTVSCGMFPEEIGDLPSPDRVFVGGGGHRLTSILNTVMRDLKPEGIVVVNTVLLKSMQTAFFALKESGFKPTMIQMQVNHNVEMPQGERLEAQNPVWIISGQKPLT
jgi:precorrin-6Y C5,15-methyltransferase (decarboxylating)